MGWNYSDIVDDWLSGGKLDFLPDVVVEAFDTVDRVLGPKWIQRSRMQSGTVSRGSAPTSKVVSMGLRLATVEDLSDTKDLIDKLRRGDSSAGSELTAIYLLRARHSFTTDLYPDVMVGSKKRVPDFRILSDEGEPVYVEVTQAVASQAQKEASAIMSQLASVVPQVSKSFALEVLLNKEPDEVEMDILQRRILEFCQLEGAHQEELRDLGRLLLGETAPGRIVLTDRHQGSGPVQLMLFSAMKGPGEPHRHIMVTMPFSDERAGHMLREEARQLPTDSPGLIIIDVSGTAISPAEWGKLIEKRLHPGQHTRVSGVAIIQNAPHEQDESGQLSFSGRIIFNRHAKYDLPDSVRTTLTNSLSA